MAKFSPANDADNNGTMPRFLNFAIVLLLCWSVSGHAQDLIDFSIDSQPLPSALTQYADQCEVQILFQSSELPDIRIPALKGKYTAREAISRLLDNTGLEYVFGGNDTVVVRRKKDAASSAGDESHLIKTEKVTLARNDVSKGTDSLHNPAAGQAVDEHGSAERPAALAMEEVIVTAQKREQSLQDVPLSVMALSGQAILQGGWSDMQDLSDFVPNLSISEGLLGPIVRVRGIGTAPTNTAFEQAVAQFHDGVYYGRVHLSQNTVFDLERIEIVRGPQPTFAGLSATAGVLNYISRKPAKSWGGYANLQYGSDEELSAEAAFGGPVSDSFGVRVAARYYELDDPGYKNAVTGEPEGNMENKSVRITGVWKPSEAFELTLKYEYQDVFQNGIPGEYFRCETRPRFSTAGFVAPGLPALCALDAVWNGIDLNNLDHIYGQGGYQDAREAVMALNRASGAMPGSPGFWGTPQIALIAPDLNDVEEFNGWYGREHEAHIFSVSFDWRIPGGLTLSSTTTYLEYDKKDVIDPDESSFAVFADHRFETFDQTAQEIRLSSPADQTLSWMVGLYWQQHNLDTSINVFLPWLLGPPPLLGALFPGSRARSFGGLLEEEATWISGFFAATWNVNDTFRINIGGRYQDVDKDGTLFPTQALLANTATAFGPRFPSGAPVSGKEQADDFLPEVGLQLQASENIMLYGKYSEAMKAGGFVMSPAIGGGLPNPFSYKPEFAEGFEAGFKGRLFNNRLQLNISFYDTDYTDLQVGQLVTETGQFITTNAASAHSRGVEFDGRWALTGSFVIGFSGHILGEAEYDEYTGAPCNSLEDKLWVAAGNGPPGSCNKDLDGVAFDNFAEWSFDITPQFVFDIGDYQVTASANIFFSDGYSVSTKVDPFDTVGNWERVDLRLAVAPLNGNWELAFYGRDVTDQELRTGWMADILSKSSDLVFDAGGARHQRGARYGVQLSYFFGR